MAGEHQGPARAYQQGGLTFEVYRCRRCDRASVVLDPDVPVPQCHGEPMTHAGGPDRPVTHAALGDHLAEAFGVPRSGSDVCYALLVGTIDSIDAVADRIDRDCRTVARHLDRLAAADLLDRTSLPREDEGTVEVYRLADGQERPTTLGEFCRWANRAAGEPASAAPDSSGDGTAAAFRDAFCSGTREQSASSCSSPVRDDANRATLSVRPRTDGT
jgi:predicted transcriptional regulator